MDLQEVINKKVNRLTIVSRGSKKHYVVAICECGSTKEYYVYNVLSGHAASCGCFTNTYKTHGMSKVPLYKRWIDIKKRCFNPKHQAYDNYGGRGIIMCDDWADDFVDFYNWAVNNGWSAELEIDRINNNGNYEPSNCRFVSRIENANNRRKSLFIIVNNERKTLSQWAREYNISPLALHSRIKNNWDVMDALTMPIAKKGNDNTYANRVKAKMAEMQPQ